MPALEPLARRRMLAGLLTLAVSASGAAEIAAQSTSTEGLVAMSSTDGTTHPQAPFANASNLAAPSAEKRPHELTQHGETRVDNYAWLKDANWQTVLRDPSALDPEIRAHLAAELTYYEAVMADEADLRTRLFEEMRGRIKEDESSVPSADGPYAYYERFRTGCEYPIVARIPREGGEEQILFDGDAEAGDSDFFDVGAVVHSPDHALIAYSVDRLGSEYYTLRFRRLSDGSEFEESIESTSGDAIWSADSKSVLYVERDDHQRPKRVKHHVLGTDPSSDRTLYEEPDDGMFVGISESQSGEYIFIESANQVTSEVRFVASAAPGDEPTLIAPRVEDELYDVDHHGDEFFIRTNADGAVDFKLVRTPIDAPGRDHWADFVAHEAGTYIVSFVPYRDHIVRLERSDALPRLVIAKYDGTEHVIEFDQAAYSLSLDAGYEYETSMTRFGYESPSQPEQVFDYNMATGERILRKTQEVPSGHNPDLYLVERITAPAADGAEIPITLLRLKATPVDGTAPLLLYGYGSYGATMPAAFSTGVLPMVDRGLVYAIAHVRGGAARGRQWYLDGKLDKKMNTFTDFVAAAETLIKRGYSTKGRILSYGGSAGGLLVGATVNLRPDLFGGVLAAVPFVDVLNTISDEGLPLTPPEWPEWGDPIHTRDGYEWIKSYSPYENIRRDVAYPPILATGGLTDYRVTYWEPAKWVARLRAEAKGGPFLLRMNMEAGHGGSAARFEQLKERAHLYAFALKVLAMTSAEPVSHAQ